MALSTAEAEYVATMSSGAQVLWLKQQLLDFDIKQQIPIKSDNTSAINLTKNPYYTLEPKTLSHHFLQDHPENGEVILEHVDTKHQLADILTKPLAFEPFFNAQRELGILDVSALE